MGTPWAADCAAPEFSARRVGVLWDLSAILAEIERLRPEPPLFPQDPAQRARALAIEEHFDEEVAPDLRRLFWST